MRQSRLRRCCFANSCKASGYENKLLFVVLKQKTNNRDIVFDNRDTVLITETLFLLEFQGKSIVDLAAKCVPG